MPYLFLFNARNGFVNAPPNYVMRTLPVLLLTQFGYAKSVSYIKNLHYLRKQNSADEGSLYALRSVLVFIPLCSPKADITIQFFNNHITRRNARVFMRLSDTPAHLQYPTLRTPMQAAILKTARWWYKNNRKQKYNTLHSERVMYYKEYIQQIPGVGDCFNKPAFQIHDQTKSRQQTPSRCSHLFQFL